MQMKALLIAWLMLGAVALLGRAENSTLYENNFEQAEAGKVPADMLVLDGGFVVKEESGNKYLELPGAPLDSFSVQFGRNDDTERRFAQKKAAERHLWWLPSSMTIPLAPFS